MGVSGGNGVLLIRDKHSGKWMGPAFYTLGGGQFRDSGRRGSLGGSAPDYDRTRG
jgi:lipid-binding SYLF domain-containing protein